MITAQANTLPNTSTRARRAHLALLVLAARTKHTEQRTASEAACDFNNTQEQDGLAPEPTLKAVRALAHLAGEPTWTSDTDITGEEERPARPTLAELRPSPVLHVCDDCAVLSERVRWFHGRELCVSCKRVAKAEWAKVEAAHRARVYVPCPECGEEAHTSLLERQGHCFDCHRASTIARMDAECEAGQTREELDEERELARPTSEELDEEERPARPTLADLRGGFRQYPGSLRRGVCFISPTLEELRERSPKHRAKRRQGELFASPDALPFT